MTDHGEDRWIYSTGDSPDKVLEYYKNTSELGAWRLLPIGREELRQEVYLQQGNDVVRVSATPSFNDAFLVSYTRLRP